MGLAKSQMIEDQERGWHDLDTHVCANCVDDIFLKSLINENLEVCICDYCGEETVDESAAPTNTILGPIADALHYFFSDPTSAGVPYETREGGFAVAPTYTEDALLSLPLDCNDKLFEDVASAFINDAWVPAANGHWASSHRSTEMLELWGRFVYKLKHEVRYFFNEPVTPTTEFGIGEQSSRQILATIADHVEDFEFFQTIDAGTLLYRTRVRTDNSDWVIDPESMSSPPPELAAAGRMNPAGISYFYLAFEHNTACAEVLPSPPCKCALAEFKVSRDLCVLDLTNIPDIPSIFDRSNSIEREVLLFLSEFVEQISLPIQKDGREHVEYVPSQVVCEYFALVYKRNGQHLDGLVYPSAVRRGGRNIVLFPKSRGYPLEFDQVAYSQGWQIELPTWETVSAYAGNGALPKFSIFL